MQDMYPTQIDIGSYRRERIRQLREEWSRKSPLLELPGGKRKRTELFPSAGANSSCTLELRNKIYKYIIDSVPVKLKVSSLPGA
jgi:hypothetical protein